MLPHRSRPRHGVAPVDFGRMSSETISSTSTVAYPAAAVSGYASRSTVTLTSGHRLRSVAERAQLSLVSLPIPLPLLNSKHSRSMSAGASKPSLSAGMGEEFSFLDSNFPPALDTTTGSAVSPGLGSRKPGRLFAALRRSSSPDQRRSGRTVSGRGMFSTAAERSTSVSPAGSRAASPARTSQPPTIAQIAMGLHTSRTPHLGPAHGFLIMSDPGARNGSAVHLHHHHHPHAHSHSHTKGRGSNSPQPSGPQTASSSTRVATPLRSSLKKEKTDVDPDLSRSTSPSVSASSVPIPITLLSRPALALSRISLAITTTKNNKNSTTTGNDGGGGRSSGSGRSRLDKFLGRGLGRGRGPKSPLDSVASIDGESLPRKAVRFVSHTSTDAETARIATSRAARRSGA